MFGYPTGVGCLLARREALGEAAPAVVRGRHHHRRVGAGRRHYLAESEAAFEDGTPDYLQLPAVEIGLDHLERWGCRSSTSACGA